MTWSSPEPLTTDHFLADFDCGRDSLNVWLTSRAGKNEDTGASRTFVVCKDGAVVGYYALASAAIESRQAPGSVKRNMPDPIPALLLARLAIDRKEQGRGLGQALLRDAMLRSLRVSKSVGVRVLLVHALDEAAAKFYRAFGFVPSPIDPLVLMIQMKTIEAAL